MRNITITTQTTTDIISKSDLKGFLEIDNTDYDTILEKIATAASYFIKTETGQEFVETEYKEVIDGEGTKTILLSEMPVISIDSILVDDETLDTDDYAVYNEASIVKRKDKVFPEGDLNIEINYKAGYGTIPGDLELAAKELGAFKFQNRDYIGLSSHSYGDETVEFNRKDVPQEIMATIDNYKPVV